MKQRMRSLRNLVGTIILMGIFFILMPEIQVRADDYDFSQLIPTDEEGDEPTALQVTFNGYQWYIIKYDEREKEVTLFAAGTIGEYTAYKTPTNAGYPEGANYNTSTINTYLKSLAERGGEFAGVAHTINDVDLVDVSTENVKLYVLSQDEAEALPVNVRKLTSYPSYYCWWLRTPAKNVSNRAMVVSCDGEIGRQITDQRWLIRPALHLNLNEVTFSSETRTFTPNYMPHEHSFRYSASGATVTATCENEGCDLPDNKVCYSIVAPARTTVDGTESAQATLVGLTEFNKLTGKNVTSANTTSPIKYEGRGKTVYGSGTKAPTAAGAYTAKFTFDNLTISVDYVIRNQINYTVTFNVYNGRWNDGTGTSITVPLNGYEGDELLLKEIDIPSVGDEPDAGFCAGSWNVTPDTVTPITKDTVFNYRYSKKISVKNTVTFRVENGMWNDGTSLPKMVLLPGYLGEPAYLQATDIPAVGEKPGTNYIVGSWDVTPDTAVGITEDTTFTYSYHEKDVVYHTVTFKVENGFWDDGTRGDKSVIVQGYEGAPIYLKESDIPGAGGKPDPDYKTGSWDAIPDTTTSITKDTTYIYTYAAYEKTVPTGDIPTAIVDKNGNMQIYVNGKEDKLYEGLAAYDEDGNGSIRFIYVRQGKQDTDKLGFVDFNGGKFLVAYGEVATTVNGLFNDPDHPEKWYFLAAGQVQLQHTGLAEYDGEWFYLENGKLDTTLNAYVDYDGGKFFVGAGRIIREANGLNMDPQGTDWYYLAKGQAQTQYTGLAFYDDAWFYVINGKLASDYSGPVVYDGNVFYVTNGMLVEDQEL